MLFQTFPHNKDNRTNCFQGIEQDVDQDQTINVAMLFKKLRLQNVSQQLQKEDRGDASVISGCLND